MGISRSASRGRSKPVALLSVGLGLVCVDGAAAQSLQLPEIEVAAPSQPRTAATPGSSLSPWVVTPDEIDRSTARTLGELLATRPGITSSGFAPGAASRPVIRGLDNYRVRIQQNGVGSHDVSQLGEDHAVPIDPLAARQVDVIRGPAALRYGSQAVGGVVDASNNRIPDALPAKGLRFESMGAASSVDKGFEGSALLDAGAGNFAFHADAYARSAGDYGIPSYPYLSPPSPAPVVGRRQPNSAMRANGQSVGGSYLFDGGYAGVAISQYRSFYHVPGLDSAEENSRIDLRQTRITSKGEFRPQTAAIDSIRYWLGATDYKHNEVGTEGGVDGIHQTFTNKEWEGRVEVQLAAFNLRWASLQTSLGVQAGDQRLTSSGEEGSLFDPNRTRMLAGYVFNELRFAPGTRAQIAGRIEQVSVRGAMPDFAADPEVSLTRNLNFTPKSGSIALLQDLPWGLTASVTGQYIERAPRAPELLSQGSHHATGTFDIGNPNLGIEAAQTLEFGLKRAQGPLRFDASVYHTRYRGFIYRRLTGATCGDTVQSCEQPGHDDHDHEHEHEHEEHGHDHAFKQAIYSQRNARFTGAEIAAQFDVAPLAGGMFGIDGQYDIVRARFDDGTNIPRIPPQRVGGGVWWRSDQWFARVGMLHAFAQNNIAAEETPTAGYNLLRAELTHTYKFASSAGAHALTLGLVGDNLLNADIRNAVSFRKDEVLQPGRSVRAFAKLVF